MAGFGIEGWIAREPLAGLWVLVCVALLFGVGFTRLRQPNDSAWAWLAHLLEALVGALGFAIIAGLVFFLLNSNFSSFNRLFGSFTAFDSQSNKEWRQMYDKYGGRFVQYDLKVNQWVTVETLEEIQPEDPTGEVLYRNVKVRQPVEKTNIASFRGQAFLTRPDGIDLRNSFMAYELSASYEYKVINPVGETVLTEFRFPLSRDTKNYRSIFVSVDDKEISNWQVDNQEITWSKEMSPGEEDLVLIRYQTSGMDGYLFEIPTQREISFFKFELTTNILSYYTILEPYDTKIITHYVFGSGDAVNPSQKAVWSIYHSILALRLGIDFIQGQVYDPQHDLIISLPYAGRAAILFLAMFTLTLLICGVSFDLKQTALAAGLFMIPFIGLMGVGRYLPVVENGSGIFASSMLWLPVLTTPCLGLTWLLLKKLPRLPLVLTLVLMAFFCGGYALIGLEMDEQKRNAFEIIVQAVMIGYVFGLALFNRLRGERSRQAVADG